MPLHGAAGRSNALNTTDHERYRGELARLAEKLARTLSYLDLFAQMLVVGVQPGCGGRQLSERQAIVIEHLDQSALEVIDGRTRLEFVAYPVDGLLRPPASLGVRRTGDVKGGECLGPCRGPAARGSSARDE